MAVVMYKLCGVSINCIVKHHLQGRLKDKVNLQILDKEVPVKVSRLVLISALAVATFLLVAWSLVNTPRRYGDGWEYLGMTVSFTNHLSPDLRDADISESTSLLARSGETVADAHSGYFADRNGKWYSYHFWFYSLLAAGPYLLLKALGLNPFLCFQLANVLLYSLVMYWVAFRFHSTRRLRAWLLLSLVVNPILLYLPWPHPEVLTFVCLFIGLLEYSSDRKIAAVVLTAIASLQNPGAALITAFIVLEELYRGNIKRTISLGFYSLLVLLPYVWTWFHYRKFSIIGEISTGPMDLGKALNLFFDLNAGLIVYVPVLMVGLLWLLVRGNITAGKWAVLLVLISLVCSAQLNWNSGMAYINRYGSWLTPILMVATIPLVAALKRRSLSVVVSLFVATSGGMLVYCINDYNGYNYVRLQPVAKAVIAAVPAIYNPPADVFAERVYGSEIELSQLNDTVVVANEHGVRKTLVANRGRVRYVNAFPVLAGHYLGRVQLFKANEDIFTNDLTGSLAIGWHGPSKTPGGSARWISDEASLLFNETARQDATISFKAGSFLKPRHMKVVLNDKSVLETVVPPSPSEVQIEFKCDVAAFNTLAIYSAEAAQAPAELTEIKSLDTRKLAFELRDFRIR